ncbi:hypothetical protein HPB50_020387 [Hyalomma asiaticum]|uniref:Uncharacterized protein n=1 Tax=Hyalomma asiaticum TaxID=266040 RepID=A0ACB7T8U5_HYAAI|nr:hypothetical protein HPB50_020387 [Hyalomma asiaticum]
MTAKFTTAVHDLKGEMKVLHSSNLALKAELTSVRASMDFINESFEEFKSEIKALRSEVKRSTVRGAELALNMLEHLDPGKLIGCRPT